MVDFLCIGARLVVEIDGGQHTPERDDARTAFLTSQGYRVLRFWNNQVDENLAGVLQTIAAAVGAPPSSSSD